MNGMQWTLIGVGYLLMASLVAICMGRLFRINVEAPKQRARRVMKRGVKWDIDQVVAEAIAEQKPEIERW